MKYALTLIAALFITCLLQAQHLVESEEFKISFETSELLENYETESSTVLGYDNENYAVDIEIVSLDQTPDRYLNNQKQAAYELAKDLGLRHTVDGGTIPYIYSAYYVISKEKEQGILIPVYVLFIVNTDLNLVYEITVYCYNNNLQEGERITKSFRFYNASSSGADD
ncbi:MAG: hypothetical protein JXR19_04220 [Bacteroidia bacterium]